MQYNNKTTQIQTNKAKKNKIMKKPKHKIRRSTRKWGGNKREVVVNV